MGCHAGCALHSTFQTHSGKIAPVPGGETVVTARLEKADMLKMQAATPYMREAAKKEIAAGGSAKNRCIINVSSTTGTHGNAGQVQWHASLRSTIL